MRRTTALLGCLLLLAAPGAATADDKAEIPDLKVAVEGHRVLLSFDLQGAFDDRFVERVDSGLPTTIVYRFQLLRDRKRWFDRGLETMPMTVVAMYDAVRREYLVNFKLDGRLIDSRMVHDLPSLERAMTHFERLPAFSLGPQRPGSRLLVRGRAELGSGTFLLLFPTTIGTDWTESRKFRPPPELVR